MRFEALLLDLDRRIEVRVAELGTLLDPTADRELRSAFMTGPLEQTILLNEWR